MDKLEQLGWEKEEFKVSSFIRYSHRKQSGAITIVAYIDIFKGGSQIDLYEQIGDEAGYLYLTKQELLALAEIVKEM